MTAWSFSEEFDNPPDKTYLASVANGLQSEIEPLHFDVTIKKEKNQRGPLIDMTVVTVRTDLERNYNDDYKVLINKFPSWTYPIEAQVHINGYTF
jgi:hypothetical protein